MLDNEKAETFGSFEVDSTFLVEELGIIVFSGVTWAVISTLFEAGIAIDLLGSITFVLSAIE